MEEMPELQELCVEVELRQKRNRNDKYKCILQEIAVEFAKRLPILPLTKSIDYLGKCFQFPGVYLIYYVGETSLYGDRVYPSQDRPIYVGMSRKGFFNRLEDHCRKLARAKDLEAEDFFIRFIILDIECYVLSVEGVLIEYYSPLWNDRKVNLSFGNADDPANNWYKYHVAKDEYANKEVIKCVRMYYQEEEPAPSDHHTSVNPP